MMAVVFITQVPERRDRVSGLMTPVVDIHAAEEHGEPRVLLPPEANFFATKDYIQQLREGLQDYNFERGDSLIALGHSEITAVAGAILAERHRKFIVLRWDRYTKRYVRITIAL
jgi:hypothetical protein